MNWELAKQPKAYSRVITLPNGKTDTLGAMERPQLLVENNIPRYLFVAVADGNSGFINANKTWNLCIPIGNGTCNQQ